MIKGTNAYCKIINVNVSESTATITLLIFATQSTYPAKSFRICLKDADSEGVVYVDDNSKWFVDNNVYWIDHINNYSFDSTNVDTNKHKEITVTIDISKNNTAEIKDNRWVRNCYLYLINSEDNINSAPAWSSDLLTLISDEFEIPEIENVSFSTVDLTRYVQDNELKGKINCKFKLVYQSEKDFNYNNDNFSAKLNVRSIATDNILETKDISVSYLSLDNEITTSNDYPVGNKYVFQILITDKNGGIVRDVRKIYTPRKKYSNTYIKTKTGIKRVLGFFVNLDAEEEHEGAWL